MAKKKKFRGVTAVFHFRAGLIIGWEIDGHTNPMTCGKISGMESLVTALLHNVAGLEGTRESWPGHGKFTGRFEAITHPAAQRVVRMFYGEMCALADSCAEFEGLRIASREITGAKTARG